MRTDHLMGDDTHNGRLKPVKLPPHNLEAEKSAIGSALLLPELIDKMLIETSPSDFYNPVWRDAWRGIGVLHRTGQKIDPMLLCEHLGNRWAGNVGLLAEAMATDSMNYHNGVSYCRIVHAVAKKRRMLSEAKLVIDAIERDENIETIRQQFIDRTESAESVQPFANGRSLVDFYNLEIDNSKCLLGNRFLCVEGTLLFVGPSGIGKSSASAQMEAAWAVGHESFGIKPTRPLKILTVQAEDDDGDMREMAQGVINGLNLTTDELKTLHSNTIFISCKCFTGAEFLSKVVKPALERYRPDILRLNPLHSYCGCKVEDTEQISKFTRTGLNPLLEKHQCAAIVNHHTPKVTNRDTSGWRASDWSYAGAGAADLTNWARAIIVIDPANTPGIFKFIAPKRGNRLDWKDHNGEKTIVCYFSHSRVEGEIFWTETPPEEIEQVTAKKAKETTKTKADLESDIFKAVPESRSIPKKVLISIVGSKNRTDPLIDEIIHKGKLYRWDIPRPGVRPEVHVALFPQPSEAK